MQFSYTCVYMHLYRFFENIIYSVYIHHIYKNCIYHIYRSTINIDFGYQYWNVSVVQRSMLYIYMYIYKIAKFHIQCIYTYIQAIFKFHIQCIYTVYIAVYIEKYIYIFCIYDIYKKSVYIIYTYRHPRLK